MLGSPEELEKEASEASGKSSLGRGEGAVFSWNEEGLGDPA